MDEEPLKMRKMGVMRYVSIIIDYSGAMLATQPLYPSLVSVTVQLLKDFVQKFFQFNPIAQIGIILCTDRRPNRLVAFTSDTRTLVDTLSGLDYASCTGEFSLQSSLQMAANDLSVQPGYASREIVVISGSLSTIDPGNIFTTFEDLKRQSIRASVIGLCAELFVFRKLTTITHGRCDTVLDQPHFQKILNDYIKPVVLPKGSESNLIRVCFPIRDAVFEPPVCVCHRDDFSQLEQAYICAQCGAHFCSTPVECGICGVLLITSPQLARTFQHLLQLDEFNEIDEPGQCYACHVNAEKRTVCPKCGQKFCKDCDELIHRSLQICPSCA
uniref:VWFA domain-containing protein n=1 Tax=Bursaphelenchus xylophilus TaxID=6326 RepID=A0A1I7S5R7_BURXY